MVSASIDIRYKWSNRRKGLKILAFFSENFRFEHLSMSHYTQLTPEFFQNVLTPADMQIIRNTTETPKLIPAIHSIIGYSKTVVQNNITAQVVQQFQNAGITLFGTTVRDCQTKIAEFLDYNPECRDVDARKCFNKILYKIAYRHWLPHLQNLQNQQEENQPAIGFRFG